MEFTGLAGGQRGGMKLSVSAYGVGGVRSRREIAGRQAPIDVEDRKNALGEKLTERNNGKESIKNIKREYQEINQEIVRMRETRKELEVENRKLEHSIMEKIQERGRFGKGEGKGEKEYVEEIRNLMMILGEREKQIERLTREGEGERSQKVQSPLESTLEELSVIYMSGSMEETEEKLQGLMEECLELRKEIQSQSLVLTKYEEKLRAEKAEKAEIMFILEQKEKLIENLLKDKENVMKQSCSYALSYSLVDDLNSHEGKSFTNGRALPFDVNN